MLLAYKHVEYKNALFSSLVFLTTSSVLLNAEQAQNQCGLTKRALHLLCTQAAPHHHSHHQEIQKGEVAIQQFLL